MPNYQVIVGNIGCVYDGEDYHNATQVALTYIRAASLPFGRASGEDVTIMCDGHIHTNWPSVIRDEKFTIIMFVTMEAEDGGWLDPLEPEQIRRALEHSTAAEALSAALGREVCLRLDDFDKET